MAHPEKMSKSRGNVVMVDEVVYGVCEITDGYEFRNINNEPIEDFRAIGIWRDKGGDGNFYSSLRTGKHPVFLCKKGEPVPCHFSTNDMHQHPSLLDYWRRMLELYEDKS